MRSFTVTVLLGLVSASVAQHCTFKDSGFKQCVSNYTNWVQVQLAQTKEFTVRIINAMPEPTEKHAEHNLMHHQHSHSISLLQNHNMFHRRIARAIEDNDVDSSEEFVTTAAPVKHNFDHHFTHATQSSAEAAVGRGLTWQQFKREVVRIVETTLDNAGLEMTNGVETLTHTGGIHDIRSLVCIYSSLSTITIKASAALGELYKKLDKEQRPRFEKGLAFPLLMAAKRVDGMHKSMEKEMKNCYFLLI